MKNLFTHEILSDDDETYVPFENPYLVSRVSSETEQLMHCTPEDHDEPTLSDEEKNALKSKEKTFLLQVKPDKEKTPLYRVILSFFLYIPAAAPNSKLLKKIFFLFNILTRAKHSMRIAKTQNHSDAHGL